jgi:hypothetical protein
LIKTLREGLIQPGSIGEVPAKEDSKAGSSLLSNQMAFEQYRRMVEMDNRGKDPSGFDFNPEAIIFNVMLFSEWALRYRRRLDTVKGNYGRLADIRGMKMLVNWQHARDSKVLEITLWDKEMRSLFDMAIQNEPMGLNVKALDGLHEYGPSLRRSWQDAKSEGASDKEACLAIITWARHQPEAWQAADERKKKGLVVEGSLGQRLNKKVNWSGTADLENPWQADVEGENWLVKINDFPDDYLYTLIINGLQIGKIHEWPVSWMRE